MITLVEGMIGSGKTYFVVNEVLKTYFDFDEARLIWVLKPDEDVAIFSNVDRFAVSLDLVEAIRISGGLNPFFTVPFQKEFSRLKRHIYIIDEAQSTEFFHRKFYDSEVFDFFRWMRHLGIDVYLITQDVTQLAKELQTLPEYHIRVTRRSYSYAKEFRYNYMVGKEIYKRRTLVKDLRVFMAYRSSNVIGGGHEVKRFAVKYYVYVACFVLLAAIGFVGFIKYRFSPKKQVVAVEQRQAPERYKVVAVSGEYVYLRSQDGKKLLKTDVSKVIGQVKVGTLVNLRI